MTKFEMKLCKKFNPFWIVTIINTLCRCSCKTQKKIFKDTMTIRIPNFDVKVILSTNDRWDIVVFEIFFKCFVKCF